MNDEFLVFAPAAAWPFVHILNLAHIPGINHLINVTICLCYFFVLIAQFYIAISPISGTPSNLSNVATAFFQSYLAIPVVVLFCIDT